MYNFENPVHFNRDATQVWSDYYTKRSKNGSGLPGYHGDIYQRGYGLWGDIFKMALPVVKYLGVKTADTLLRSGSDALKGADFVDSLKKRGKAAAGNIVDDIADKAVSLGGNGEKNYNLRKRKKPSKSKKKTSNKRRKNRRKSIFL